MKTIVFLDFDDVLAIHSEHTSSAVVAALKSGAADQAVELWENIFHHTAQANLRTLYDEFAPRFVISSSWATYLSREQVSEVLSRSGLGFVAEALHEHWCSAIELGAFRATEIATWLKQHEYELPFAYAILDDTSSGKSLFGTPLESHAVFCEEWTGFVDNMLQVAQKILRVQLSK